MRDYLTHTFDFNDADLVSVTDELPLWSAPFGLKLLETVRLKPDMSVLDIGCGLGFPFIELAERLGRSCHVYGVDPWTAAVDRVHRKISTFGITNATVVRGVSERLPFADAIFDLMVSNNGINNVEDLARTLGECARVCRPGARFVVTVNLDRTMREFYEVFEAVLQKNGLQDEVSHLRAHIHSKRKPLSELRALIEKAGFGIGNIAEDAFLLKFQNGSAMFRHHLIKYSFLGAWKEVLEPADMERVFGETEERLNRIAEDRELILTVPFVTIDGVRR